VSTYTPDEFADHLMEATVRVTKETVAVVRRGLVNVKNDGRRNAAAAGGQYLKHLPRTIAFDDVHADGLVISGEVGYLSGPQAELGALAEYGGGRAHNAPQRNLGRALDTEEPKFVRAMADAGEKALK
jgi:hypothetical protein